MHVICSLFLQLEFIRMPAVSSFFFLLYKVVNFTHNELKNIEEQPCIYTQNDILI